MYEYACGYMRMDGLMAEWTDGWIDVKVRTRFRLPARFRTKITCICILHLLWKRVRVCMLVYVWIWMDGWVDVQVRTRARLPARTYAYVWTYAYINVYLYIYIYIYMANWSMGYKDIYCRLVRFLPARHFPIQLIYLVGFTSNQRKPD